MSLFRAISVIKNMFWCFNLLKCVLQICTLIISLSDDVNVLSLSIFLVFKLLNKERNVRRSILLRR